MIAERHGCPTVFSSTDDLLAWMVAEFQSIIDSNGIIIFDVSDAQALVDVYNTLTISGN